MATYTPLQSDPLLVPDAPTDGWGTLSPREIRHESRRSFSVSHRLRETVDRTACLSLLACLISVVSLTIQVMDYYGHPSPPTPSKLSYPNPYIGLEKAVLTETDPAAPIINFPLLLSQINSSNPSAVYLQQPHSPTSFGMIYTEDREFMVDHEVSTIVQFRTLDFRMERCVATLEVPSPIDIQNLPNKNISSSSQPFSINVWSLDGPDDIDPLSLSWNVRPAKIGILTTMIVNPGRNLVESPPFFCPSRTLVAFEISCGTSSCHLHFRQDKKAPRLAFFITQYPNDH
ncbi:hypothetical protein B0H13DRAFT_2165794 [Mycena leptocephala]|nr:hypothetical protein B0H13DRAFT_2165794 [Mycena leptocephala]